MRIDLGQSFNQGMNLLLAWRNRYSSQEYPEKVLLNMFYKKYTMEFMWDEINNSFQKKFFGGKKVLWDNFNKGFQKLHKSYQQNAISKTQPVLMNLLSEKSERMVGNTSYADFKVRIDGAKQGNKKDIEEIEYAYLYYFLTDECILLWSAFGGTGLNKIESISQMSGVIIETPEIKTYKQIEGILGRLCAAAYLHEVYKPLPPL